MDAYGENNKWNRISKEINQLEKRVKEIKNDNSSKKNFDAMHSIHSITLPKNLKGKLSRIIRMLRTEKEKIVKEREALRRLKTKIEEEKSKIENEIAMIETEWERIHKLLEKQQEEQERIRKEWFKIREIKSKLEIDGDGKDRDDFFSSTQSYSKFRFIN
jgi:chromosome segregation ATPase